MLDRLAGTFRNFSFDGRKTVDFLPEHDRIAQLALRNRPQPLMVLAQHKRTAARFHPALISL